MRAIEPEEVQLASPAVLARLLGIPVSAFYRKRAQRALHAEQPPQEPHGAGFVRACSCGMCRACRENARWNRIFDEKFADPSYYDGLVVRYNSSLAGV